MFMTSLMVKNVPTICIDGKITFVSRIPPKEELIAAINEARGIAEAPAKADKSIKAKKAGRKEGATRAEIKTRIKELKVQRRNALEAQDRKMATIYKRRISRLKKKSRKAAA